jgi:uroporphyrinogen-III decarboxylase
MAQHPAALEAALGVVNANLIRYAQASLARGAAGIFLSGSATSESPTLEQYEQFMRPFDLQLLEAIRGKGECHVLHAHGEHLYFDRLLDYPAHALSWADLNGGPAIADARRRTAMTLMTGLNHVTFAEESATLVRAQMKRAPAAGGNTRFILAPGCSLPTYAYPSLIRAARAESGQVGSATAGGGRKRSRKRRSGAVCPLLAWRTGRRRRRGGHPNPRIGDRHPITLQMVAAGGVADLSL